MVSVSLDTPSSFTFCLGHSWMRVTHSFKLFETILDHIKQMILLWIFGANHFFFPQIRSELITMIRWLLSLRKPRASPFKRIEVSGKDHDYVLAHSFCCFWSGRFRQSSTMAENWRYRGKIIFWCLNLSQEC